MNLSAPFFLYALAAIAIPLIIHLWSKNTKSKVPFGSLKFIKETETKTTRHLWPSELLLLVVRILTVGFLVLCLANPFINQPAESLTAHLIDPQLDQAAINKVLSSLDPSAKTYWLSPEGKELSDSINMLQQDIWSTLDVFRDYDSLVVFSPLLMSGFKSALTPPKSKINWVEIPLKPSGYESVSVSKNGKSYAIIPNGNSDLVTFEQELTQSQGEPIDIQIWMKVHEKHQALGDKIRSALNSINELSIITFKIGEFKENPAPQDWVVWLSEEVFKPRKNLIYSTNEIAGFKQVSDRVYTISSDLSIEKMLAENFPLHLEHALTEDQNGQFDLLDQRKIPEIYLVAGEKSKELLTTKKSFANWTLVLFLLLLTTERLISQVKVKK
ncbi:MAG: BatA domain-containing protein [Marinoscillum sp.]